MVLSKSKSKIVLIRESSLTPLVKQIELELGVIQKLVGGYIEEAHLIPKRPYVALFDEEGRLKDREETLFIPGVGDIVGTIVVLAVTRDGDDWRGLLEEEVVEVLQWLDRKLEYRRV